ncbi:hypothetical protein FOA52_008442 [Chlamydomonas sp. UWO 241]|nr:hypothetical protein FOA52_008442 [Chlamydomonas sp. UWO 241]
MYPTVPKAFEAGGAADTAADSAGNLAYAGVAAGIAAGAVLLTLVVGGGTTGTAEDFSEYEQYSSLSTYRASFAADAGLAKVAPVPSLAASE